MKETHEQIRAFKRGFYKLLHKSKLREYCTAEDMQEIITGKKFIDVNEWQKNTVYSGESALIRPIAKLFWAIVETYNESERQLLLKFCTGSSRVPINGFAKLKGYNGAEKN